MDRRLVELLSGPEKVQALIRGGGHTHASFAEVVLARTGVGSSGDQVRHTIYAQRDTYPHVRVAISKEFRVPREEIDLLLDGEHAEESKGAA